MMNILLFDSTLWPTCNRIPSHLGSLLEARQNANDGRSLSPLGSRARGLTITVAGLAQRLWRQWLLEPGESAEALRVRAFVVFLLVHLTARVWSWDLRDDAAPQRLPLALLVTLCLVAGLWPRLTRGATAVVTLGLGVNLVLLFPFVSNHYFLEFLCVGLVSFLDLEVPAERRLLLFGVRGLAVIVLVVSGVQKIVYGTYFDGQMLGYLIAEYDRFRDVFGFILPVAEMNRLTALAGAPPGAGPYSVGSPLVVLISNAVYLGEIGLGCLLLARQTRVWAVWAALVLLVLIELGARELMFGALFANLLLLLQPRPINRLLLPFFAAAYVLLHIIDLWLPWKAFN